MDKSCQSSACSTTTSTTTNDNTSESSNSGNTRDPYLKHLHKLSHKISKPINRKPTFDSCQSQQSSQSLNSEQPQPPLSQAQAQAQQQNLQHQPPVYNVNKNDFRDVVQKLTGSPAHERISNPPPIQQPKPQSSRLQRIRPPPLAQISNRPPLLHPSTIPLPQPSAMNANNPIQNHNVNTAPVNHFASFGWPAGPLSPLPPFPTVHAAAESPVSAYMRYLRGSMPNFDPNVKQFSGFSPSAHLLSPRRHNLNHAHSQPEPPPQSQQHLPPVQQGIISSSTSPSTIQPQSQFQTLSSSLPFGCLNSPRSPYPLLSPGLLFSPTSGQLGFPQLPLSPTVPVPSPRWRGL